MSKAWERLTKDQRDAIIGAALQMLSERDERTHGTDIVSTIVGDLPWHYGATVHLHDNQRVSAARSRVEAARIALREAELACVRTVVTALESDVAHELLRRESERLLRAWLSVVELALTHSRRAETVRAPGEGARWPVPEGAVFLGAFGWSALPGEFDFAALNGEILVFDDYAKKWRVDGMPYSVGTAKSQDSPFARASLAYHAHMAKVPR